MRTGDRVAAAARELVGVRFRLHGRDAATGLDCVGVAWAALRGAGVSVGAPEGYALRCGRWTAPVIGLVEADGAAPGDVLLCRVSALQLHVAVRVPDGVVHADAGLRRVVERPGALDWPLVGAWRAGDTGLPTA